MSRHSVTVRSTTRTDDNAVLGYDPPMRTYFLHAFEDVVCDEPGLWLGIRFYEYPSLAALIAAAGRRGYTIENLAERDIADMAHERCSRRSLRLPNA